MIFGGLKADDFEGLEVPKCKHATKMFWNIRGLYFEWSKNYFEKWFSDTYTPQKKSFPKVRVIVLIVSQQSLHVAN